MATQTITKASTGFGAAAAGDSFYVLEGGNSLTANNDYSGVNQSVLLEVSPGYTGQGFTSASPMTMSFSTRFVYAAGAGDWYWVSDSLDSDVTALVYHIGGGHLHIAGSVGTSTRYEQLRGTATIGNGHTVTTGRFAGGTTHLQDTGTAAAVTTLDVLGGNVFCQRPVTTANALSGMLTIDSDSAVATNSWGTLNAWGATVNLKDAGTITTLSWLAGQLIFPQNRLITITNSTVNMSLPGAQAFLSAPNITFTNATTKVITDGRPV